jgi:hypothetical protein
VETEPGQKKSDESVSNSDSESQLTDGNDRANFRRNDPPHILYLWYVAEAYDILSTVQGVALDLCKGDGSTCQSVSVKSGSKRKREVNLAENDMRSKLYYVLARIAGNSESTKTEKDAAAAKERAFTMVEKANAIVERREKFSIKSWISSASWKVQVNINSVQLKVGLQQNRRLLTK